MKIQIKSVFSNEVLHEFDMKEVQAKSLFKKLNKYKRLLPKGYNRNKELRRYCHTVDKKIKLLTKNDRFYLSDYVGRQYIIKTIN